ncbi:RsmD family RNA methyltransferase [Candidatus Vidania fulgoroideorum]
MKIITGKLKGKKLNLSKKLKRIVRPTKSIVRKSMFEVIGKKIVKSRCLDLFCGTGSLGLEAYSRGAKEVELVDIKKPIVKAIERFIKRNNIENVKCKVRDYIRYIRDIKKKYDIIFLDPPYKLFKEQNILISKCKPLLKSKGIIFLENYRSYIKRDIKFRGFKNIKIGTKGKIIYFILKKNN